MGALSPTHWAIIIILVLLLFGSRNLPDMARGVGQSLRIFKAETQELRGDGTKADEAPAAPAAVEQGSTASTTSTGTSAPTAASTPKDSSEDAGAT